MGIKVEHGEEFDSCLQVRLGIVYQFEGQCQMAAKTAGDLAEQSCCIFDLSRTKTVANLLFSDEGSGNVSLASSKHRALQSMSF